MLGGARALLHLISFDEPFGFSVIESMACGTPVIAARLGSMPELVQDGVNGYLVDAPDQAVAAIETAGRLERAAVRASVERRFDVSRMVDDYIDVYRRVAGRTNAYDRRRRCIGAVPARHQLLARAHRDAVVDVVRRRRRTAEDFERIAARRVRLGPRVPALGGVPAGARARRCRDARAAGHRGERRPERRAADHAHAVHRAHERCHWIPGWALGGAERDARFRVVSGGRVVEGGLRNWYLDDGVVRAQALLARRAAEALAGHDALWAWDLGNENSNCVVPAHRELARSWLSQMTAAIRAADGLADVTIGIHMEDLEEDRRLGPHEAAEACDFLTMHGYPIYARWARGGPTRRWCRSWPV